MRIGLDIDGVLADFVSAHIAAIKEHTGVQLPPQSDEYPDVWDYTTDSRMAPTITKEQDRDVWKAIIKSYNFFMRMKPLEDGERILKALSVVGSAHDLYFITSRPGATAKFQTEAWLLKWLPLPTVLLAKDKGPLAASLGLELFVDDKPENCNEVVEATEGKCVVLMPERPYNRNVIIDARVARVKNLEKALERILWPNGIPEAVPLGRLIA